MLHQRYLSKCLICKCSICCPIHAVVICMFPFCCCCFWCCCCFLLLFSLLFLLFCFYFFIFFDGPLLSMGVAWCQRCGTDPCKCWCFDPEPVVKRNTDSLCTTENWLEWHATMACLNPSPLVFLKAEVWPEKQSRSVCALWLCPSHTLSVK